MNLYKTISFLSFILLTITINSQNKIIMEGKYQNRNIFVANSPTANGIGFCSFEVRINGNLITDEVNSRAYEIDLSIFNLKTGENVVVEIKHKRGCLPKVLNPEALQAKPTFKAESIDIDNEGFITWSTTEEYGALPFYIQQYKWNKWVTLGEVKGTGKPSLNKYKYKVDFVYGENKFRVVQKITNHKFRKTKTVSIESDKPRLNFIYNKKNKKLIFSNTTHYEIHDKFGQLIMRGHNSQADVTHLTKDDYFVSFDNITESFAKK